MKTVRLENTTNGHHKFWEVTWDDGINNWQPYQVRWGKIGTSPQFQNFSSYKWRIQDRITKKKSEGYVEVDEPSQPSTPKPAKPPEGKVFINVLKRHPQ